MEDDTVARNRKVAARLKDALWQHMLHGEWRPGTAIPALDALAREHHAAPAAVEHALAELVAERLLERDPGGVLRVTKTSFDPTMFRFFRFYSVDGSQFLPESRIVERAIVDPPPEAAGPLEAKPGAKTIRLKRLRLVSGEPFAAEEIYLPYTLFIPLMQIPPAEIGPLLYPLYDRLCGRVVAAVEETLSVGTSDEEHASLLGVALGTPVLIMERLALSPGGGRLEWRRTLGRGDRARYRVESPSARKA
jgi:GntR family transcriptional regulator